LDVAKLNIKRRVQSRVEGAEFGAKCDAGSIWRGIKPPQRFGFTVICMPASNVGAFNFALASRLEIAKQALCRIYGNI
jgi:hypothetical protein